MGLFSEYEKQKHEDSYGEGVKDAENASLWDDIFHGVGDIITTVVPGETTEHQSYERGYHDQQQGKVEK